MVSWKHDCDNEAAPAVDSTTATVEYHDRDSGHHAILLDSRVVPRHSTGTRLSWYGSRSRGGWWYYDSRVPRYHGCRSRGWSWKLTVGAAEVMVVAAVAAVALRGFRFPRAKDPQAAGGRAGPARAWLRTGGGGGSPPPPLGPADRPHDFTAARHPQALMRTGRVPICVYLLQALGCLSFTARPSHTQASSPLQDTRRL